MHLWSGECEISRICRRTTLTSIMVEAFSRSLALSKQLTTYRQIIFADMKPFQVHEAHTFITQTKRMSLDNDSKDLMIIHRNIFQCLNQLREINSFLERIRSVTKTVFNPENSTHTSMLNELWKGLMPSQRNPELQSSDWGLIGFQGKDPSTDFRGMGLLGLVQLNYFSRYEDGNAAREVLRIANHERRYFPFCATGINISLLCLQLLNETRLHRLLIECTAVEKLGSVPKFIGSDPETKPLIFEKSLLANQSYGALSDQSDAAESNADIDALFNQRYHKFYCETYIAWARFWESKDPRDVMSFPDLFKEFCAGLRSRMSRIDS